MSKCLDLRDFYRNFKLMDCSFKKEIKKYLNDKKV